jgi:hypothetical protein
VCWARHRCVLIDVCCLVAAIILIFFILGIVGVPVFVDMGDLVYILLVAFVIFLIIWVAARCFGMLENTAYSGYGGYRGGYRGRAAPAVVVV